MKKAKNNPLVLCQYYLSCEGVSLVNRFIGNEVHSCWFQCAENKEQDTFRKRKYGAGNVALSRREEVFLLHLRRYRRLALWMRG